MKQPTSMRDALRLAKQIERMADVLEKWVRDSDDPRAGKLLSAIFALDWSAEAVREAMADAA